MQYYWESFTATEDNLVAKPICGLTTSLLRYGSDFGVLSVNLSHDNDNQKQNTRTRNLKIPLAWLARAGDHGSLLGTELELDRRADPLGLLSVMAGILPHDRWSGPLENGYISAEA